MSQYKQLMLVVIGEAAALDIALEEIH